MQFNPDIHHRRSIRYTGYDYTHAGAYFVTLCTWKREPLLHHPEMSAILANIWEQLPQRRPDVGLDEWVIMPDHIHFIVWIQTVGRTSLSDVVRLYKSLTFNEWRKVVTQNDYNLPAKFWQRNYYERIIRNPTALEQTRLYIRNNPLRAEQHRLNHLSTQDTERIDR